MLKDMSVLDEICPSCITEEISLSLLMKYDRKIVWSFRIKSIWDIGLIPYPVYFGTRKSKC